MGGGEEEDERVVPRLEMASLPIPDELLAEILLRLPTPADLVRFSAGCVSFHRVAVDRSFLCRYRKLHAPPLLGFLDRVYLERHNVFYPAIPPYPSASAASAVALAADFSFSFLPAPARYWRVKDIRDGRILLEKPMRARNSTLVFPEAVVCDPLHRRYLLLPPIASDLTASMEYPIMTNKKNRFEIFLAPPGCGVEAGTADETSFSVIRTVQYKTRILAFAFSSNTGRWTTVLSRRWSDLSAGLPPSTAPSFFISRHYVYGCFYWLTAYSKEYQILVLDTKTMEFSIAELPPETKAKNFSFAMVEAGEGRLGMFVAWLGTDISYFIRQNDGGSSSQWRKVKTISLPTCGRLICNMDKYLLLRIGPKSSLLGDGCYTLDIETFQLEKVCHLVPAYYGLHAYRNFPPSLSSPRVSSGVKKAPEKEMLQAQAQSHQGCETSAGANAGDLAVL